MFESAEMFLSVLPDWHMERTLPVVFYGCAFGKDVLTNIGGANNFFEVQALVANSGYYASGIIKLSARGREFFVAHNAA